MAAMGQDGPTDLEGAGPGGGSDVVHDREAIPPPGSRLALWVTALLVVLVLLVPVVWALGVYARLTLIPGVDPAAAAGYLLLAILIAAGAGFYLWGQVHKSA